MDERISTIISKSEYINCDLLALKQDLSPEQQLLLDRANKRQEDFREDMLQFEKAL